MKAKIYAVSTTYYDKTTIYVGTLTDLTENVFGYSIEKNGYKRTCRTLQSLVDKLRGDDTHHSYWSNNTTYEGREATEIEKYNYWEGKGSKGYYAYELTQSTT